VTAGLRVDEVSVSYGGVHAVDGVSFSVEPGEIVGLIGPNGAGKTTLIDAISGFTAARGHITLGGTPLDGLAPHVRARSGLVRTFQSVELFDDLTVRENLAVAALPTRWWSPLVDAIHPGLGRPGLGRPGLGRPGLGRPGHAGDVDWALDAVGLASFASRSPVDLSHGQRRLVAFARALVGQPRILLLDEPAAGLDTDETAALGDLLRTIRARDVGILLVDHDMSLVLSVCSRVVVLDFGRVIATGDPEHVRNDTAVVRAYLGSAGAES
jgi:branched-chain amino acid transport system ATP-binding protein